MTFEPQRASCDLCTSTVYCALYGISAADKSSKWKSCTERLFLVDRFDAWPGPAPTWSPSVSPSRVKEKYLKTVEREDPARHAYRINSYHTMIFLSAARLLIRYLYLIQTDRGNFTGE